MVQLDKDYWLGGIYCRKLLEVHCPLNKCVSMCGNYDKRVLPSGCKRYIFVVRAENDKRAIL